MQGSPRARWIAGAVVAVAGLAAVALFGGSLASDPGDVGAPPDPRLVAVGERLYQENCASCHGSDLRGTPVGPPFLDDVYAPDHHADEAFQRAVSVGVGAHHWGFGPMPAIEGLNRDDVAAIVAFVRTAQEAAGISRDR